MVSNFPPDTANSTDMYFKVKYVWKNFAQIHHSYVIQRQVWSIICETNWLAIETGTAYCLPY